MKRATTFLVMMVVLVLVSQTIPSTAASNPTFDMTGVWKDSIGDTLQLFQEKGEVNGIYVNSVGFAHRLEGWYVSQTKAKLTMIRRTRSSGCETTMTVDITANSANSITLNSIATENACGLSIGQNFPGTATRVQ